MTTAREHTSADPLGILFERARELADRARTGRLQFIDAVDMAYSGAEFAGLVDRYGDDVIQLVLADAFAAVGYGDTGSIAA